MKRLPEQFDPANRDEAYLASLLEHVRPTEPTADQMQRVWETLERSPSHRVRGRMRGPVIVGLLLCGATAASATLPHVWKRWQRTSIEAAPADVTTTADTNHRRAPRQAPRIGSLGVPSEVAEGPAETAEPMAALPETAPRVAANRKTQAARARPTPAETGDPLASGALMVEAIRERRAGNVARARELASEYRAKNPTGALQEEALALCMESASSLGEDEAKQLASLYVQRYPRGRFRAQAERVLESKR
ncbi:MAG: hypothetical protein ABW133_12020 [Polyangiaceae bacterium]